MCRFNGPAFPSWRSFESLEHLERQLMLFVEQWNQTAQPFAWTKRSFDKVLAKVELSLSVAQLPLAA